MNRTAVLSRPSLRAAIATAAAVVERRNTIPVLSNVLIAKPGDGPAFVRGTDLDIQVTVTLPDAVADDGFAFTIPAHVLKDVEKKAPATDHVAIDAPAPIVLEEEPEDESEEDRKAREARNRELLHADTVAALDFEGLRVRMNGIHAVDFPEAEIKGEIKADFELPSAVLAEALERVQFAISTEETRYYLNGVFMHVYPGPMSREMGVYPEAKLRFVATDGHRLARHEIPLPAGVAVNTPDAIIPRKTVEFLRKLASAKGAPETVRVRVNTTKARFTIGHVDVLTKLVDGSFPDYQRVIPTGNDKRATMDRQEMIKAISAVSCISSERGRAIKLEFGGCAVRLTVNNPDAGSADLAVPCDYDPGTYGGGPLATGFNAKYLTDILSEMDSDTFTMQLADPGSPALIYDREGAATLYVLMPMRI